MMRSLAMLLTFCIASTALSKMSSSLRLIGEGDYTFMFLTVYHARLWAVDRHDLYSDNLKLELRYNMSFEGKEITLQTKKELLNAGLKLLEIREGINGLISIFPDVKKGDKIVANYNPKKGIMFYLNENILLGNIEDIKFSKSFLNIWLGPKSSDSELRDKLVGVAK